MVDLKPLVTAAVKFANGGSEAELREASGVVLDAFHEVEVQRDQWKRLAEAALQAAESGERVEEIRKRYGLNGDGVDTPEGEQHGL